MPSSTISSIDEATRFIASNQIAGWDYSPALEAAVATIDSKPTAKFVEESLPLLVPALVDPDEVRHLREHLRSLQEPRLTSIFKCADDKSSRAPKRRNNITIHDVRKSVRGIDLIKTSFVSIQWSMVNHRWSMVEGQGQYDRGIP